MNNGDTASREAYDRWHDALPADEEDAPWHTLLKQHLEPRRDLHGKHVLEIGAGRGGLAAWLAGFDDTGMLVAADFSRTATQKGRSFVGERNPEAPVRWAVADIQNLSHKPATFDTVISCETIEHVPAPDAAVAELARVLKPGGRLFLTTPNYLGIMGLYRAYRRVVGRPYTEEGQPINNFVMLPRTRRWVRRAGLRIRTTDAVGHYLPIPGRPPVEVPALNIARPLTRWVALHSLVVAEKP